MSCVEYVECKWINIILDDISKHNTSDNIRTQWNKELPSKLLCAKLLSAKLLLHAHLLLHV